MMLLLARMIKADNDQSVESDDILVMAMSATMTMTMAEMLVVLSINIIEDNALRATHCGHLIGGNSFRNNSLRMPVTMVTTMMTMVVTMLI